MTTATDVEVKETKQGFTDDEYEAFIKSIPPENWYCQKCARQFVYDDTGVATYACNFCEMMWPADFIVQFGYADLTR